MQNAVVHKAEALLDQVFKFIEANYQQSIGLNDVAQAVGYSPAYLTDLVRRQTGQPVHDWIIERRLTEACRLLRETTDSASRIAEITGYQTTGYFFRQFRQRHGTTPRVWRKIQQTKMQSSDLDRAANA
jgi:AraC-like DNA-binding protein